MGCSWKHSIRRFASSAGRRRYTGDVLDPLFAAIEGSALSRWLRESLSVFAFPGVLALHTVGLALLVGPSVALSLRLFGVVPQLRLASLRQLYPMMALGLALNTVTGLGLVVAYPTKALTNPLFYAKLVFVGVAVWALLQIRGQLPALGADDVDPAPSVGLRRLAATSLVLWFAALFAGRFLAYTYSRLLVDH